MANHNPHRDIRHTVRELTSGKTEAGRTRLIFGILHLSAPDRLEAMILTRALRLQLWLDGAAASLERHGYGREQGRIDFRDGLHLLATDRWWRLLPYGCWIDERSEVVLFDRNYCPLAHVRLGKLTAIVHPLERIDWKAQRWFYEDATAPYLDPDTLPLITMIADISGLLSEITFRSVLSDFGRIPHRVWGQEWMIRS